MKLPFDPLARINAARASENLVISGDLKVVFSKEEPSKSDAESEETTAKDLCPACKHFFCTLRTGLILAGEVIRDIINMQ
jgi:tRNA A37 threonylcarbamoyladenosine dehydratase